MQIFLAGQDQNQIVGLLIEVISMYDVDSVIP